MPPRLTGRGTGTLLRVAYTKGGKRFYTRVWYWKLRGIRINTGCTTLKDAERWRYEQAAMRGLGGLSPALLKPWTWADAEALLTERLELDKRKSAAVIRSYLKPVRAYFIGWKLSEITSDVVQRFAAQQIKAGYAIATVNQMLSWLRRALGLAYESGRIPRIPAIHRLHGANKRTGTVAPDQLAAILAQIPARYRLPLEVLWWSGWRLGEVLGLTWSGVDLDAGTMSIPTSKNGRGRTLCFAGTELESVLRRVPRTLSPWLFPGRSASHLHRSSVEVAWRKACAAAQLPGHPLVHDLRRSVSTDLKRAGVAVRDAMSVTGHTDASVHMDYVQADAADQVAALKRMAEVRAQARPKVQRIG